MTGLDFSGRLITSPQRLHSFHASVTNAELHEYVSRWQMDDISAQLHNGRKYLRASLFR